MNCVPRFIFLILASFVFVSSGAAQGNQSDAEKCDGSVYQPKEVSTKAKIISKSAPAYTEAARRNNISGEVFLTATLCRNGRVTDIQVVKGLSHGLTETAIAAAKQIKFEPAQKDGEPVSQAIELQYGFNVNPPGHRTVAKEPVEGRIVERIALIGTSCRYRPDVSRQIWGQIKTRTNNPYNKDQANLDMQALLGLSYFDSKQSHLRLEEGEKGGIWVVFVLKELPQQDLCDK